MSDCCSINEPVLTWPSSWAPNAFQPIFSFPVDWTAAVFGRYDLRARACDCPVVHNVLVDGARKDVFPPPPIWRTRGDYYDTHIDIVLGNRQADSPSWLTAAYLRAAALQPGDPGVVPGVVPLGWLSGVAVPTDFTSQELAAQAAAEQAFTTGVTLEQIQLDLAPPSPFWSSTVTASPLAKLASYQSGGLPNVPRRLVAKMTTSGVLTVDRESATILAAARAQSLREIPLFVVYA